MINRELILKAFENAKTETKESGSSNKIRSARFVENVGVELMKSCSDKLLRCFCQKVNLHENKKISGEWLIDLVLCRTVNISEKGTRNIQECKINIEWAVESEYNTSLKEFLEDFSKLINVDANNKLYLNGYCSNSLERYRVYSERRLQTASELIINYNRGGCFYFGFWPSPQLYKNDSFWVESKISKSIIQLYKWDSISDSFIKI